MLYEINVSYLGKHFFATHERSITSMDQLKNVFKVLHTRFPVTEGFMVTAMVRSTHGTYMDPETLLNG